MIPTKELKRQKLIGLVDKVLTFPKSSHYLPVSPDEKKTSRFICMTSKGFHLGNIVPPVQVQNPTKSAEKTIV